MVLQSFSLDYTQVRMSVSILSAIKQETSLSLVRRSITYNGKTFYPTLVNLETKGLITIKYKQSVKMLSLTDKGREVVALWEKLHEVLGMSYPSSPPT
jgi:DNA-binding PadR family transcriptional regulator